MLTPYRGHYRSKRPSMHGSCSGIILVQLKAPKMSSLAFRCDWACSIEQMQLQLSSCVQLMALAIPMVCRYPAEWRVQRPMVCLLAWPLLRQLEPCNMPVNICHGQQHTHTHVDMH